MLEKVWNMFGHRKLEFQKLDLTQDSIKEAIYNFYDTNYEADPYLKPSKPSAVSGVYLALVHPHSGEILAITRFTKIGPKLAKTSGTVVKATHRRKGLARQLAGYVERACRIDGITKLSCNIYVDNFGSIMSKLKQGYLIEGLLRNHDAVGRDEYILGKEL